MRMNKTKYLSSRTWKMSVGKAFLHNTKTWKIKWHLFGRKGSERYGRLVDISESLISHAKDEGLHVVGDESHLTLNKGMVCYIEYMTIWCHTIVVKIIFAYI